MRRFVLVVVAMACSSAKEPPPPRPPSCAQRITKLVAQPRWTLEVKNQANDRFLIHHDGTITWRVKGMYMSERKLTGVDVAHVARLGELSCTPVSESEHARSYSLASITELIRETSPIADALDALLETAIDRYVESRYAMLAPITITGDAVFWSYETYSPKTAIYRVAVTPDGTLTVTRGKRTETAKLDRRELVDLADKLLDPHVADERDWIRGSITTAGATRPFALARPGELWVNALGTLHGTIFKASGQED